MLVPWLFAPDATLKIYVLLVALVSPVCFAAYGWDKCRAARCTYRISEQTLLILAFIGGWPGAWLGQRVFRNDIRGRTFRFLSWLIMMLHLGFLLLAAVGMIVR